jgi:hypothetical protein
VSAEEHDAMRARAEAAEGEVEAVRNYLAGETVIAKPGSLLAEVVARVEKRRAPKPVGCRVGSVVRFATGEEGLVVGYLPPQPGQLREAGEECYVLGSEKPSDEWRARPWPPENAVVVPPW